MVVLYFTGKYNGPTIEEYIKEQNSLWATHWKFWAMSNFKDEATTWWELLNKKKCSNLLDEEFVNFLLEKWYNARKQDNEKYVGLFSTDIYLSQVHGYIQRKNIIVPINPICKKNTTNVNLAKKLQVPSKEMEHTKFSNDDVQVYKDLKIIDKENTTFSINSF